MPEAPGLLMVLAALMAWESGGFLAAGLWAAAAYLVRPGSLPLTAAFALAALLKKDARPFLKGILPTAAVLVPWSLWSSRSGLGWNWKLTELHTNYGAHLWRMITQTSIVNAQSLSRCWGSTFLPPQAPEILAACLGAGLFIAAARGAWKNRSGWSAADAFLAGSLAMHLVWPWWYDRYLLTLLPFLLWRSSDALPESLSRRAKAWTLAGILVLQFAVQGRLWFGSNVALETPPHRQAYTWIQDHTEPSEILSGPFYARDSLYTGRISVPLPITEEPETALNALNRSGVRYVLWEGIPDLGLTSNDSPVYLSLRRFEKLLEDPGLFAPTFDGGGVRIYRRIKPSPDEPKTTPIR
jgi:hypothetical protein